MDHKKLEVEGVVLIADQRRVNGEGTCRELNLTYQRVMEDDDGEFLGNDDISITLPHKKFFSQKELAKMEGKTVRITVEILG
jgi:primase-polymerase (primpol)-like protein